MFCCCSRENNIVFNNKIEKRYVADTLLHLKGADKDLRKAGCFIIIIWLSKCTSLIFEMSFHASCTTLFIFLLLFFEKVLGVRDILKAKIFGKKSAFHSHSVYNHENFFFSLQKWLAMVDKYTSFKSECQNILMKTVVNFWIKQQPIMHDTLWGYLYFLTFFFKVFLAISAILLLVLVQWRKGSKLIILYPYRMGTGQIDTVIYLFIYF